MNWDGVKFFDNVGRERRRLELSEIEGSDAVGALLQEMVWVVDAAEKGEPIPAWIIRMQPELEAEHHKRMRETVDRVSQLWTLTK